MDRLKTWIVSPVQPYPRSPISLSVSVSLSQRLPLPLPSLPYQTGRMEGQSRSLRRVASDGSSREDWGHAGFAVVIPRGDGVRILRRGRWNGGRLSAGSTELVALAWALWTTRAHVLEHSCQRPLEFTLDSQSAIRLIYSTDDAKWNQPLVNLVREELGILRAFHYEVNLRWRPREDAVITTADCEAKKVRRDQSASTDPLPQDFDSVLQEASLLFSSNPRVRPL